MKRLTLIRHAKSNWENWESDHERKLSEVGIQRAKLVGKALRKYFSSVPEKWISSDAQRAKLTAEIIAKSFGDEITVSYSEELYVFSLSELINFVKKLDNKFSDVVIFRHNSAFTEFANHFGNQSITNIPTAGVVVMSFEINDWKEIKKGEIKKIIIPKDLP